MVDKNQQIIDSTLDQEYKYGFTTDIEQTTFEPGLNEDVIKRLSKLKKEPQWLLDWRLKAYESWKKMDEPTWAQVDYTPVDYQSLSYYAAPKYKKNDSLEFKVWEKKTNSSPLWRTGFSFFLLSLPFFLCKAQPVVLYYKVIVNSFGQVL